MKTGWYIYADATVFCGPFETSEEAEHYLMFRDTWKTNLGSKNGEDTTEEWITIPSEQFSIVYHQEQAKSIIRWHIDAFMMFWLSSKYVAKNHPFIFVIGLVLGWFMGQYLHMVLQQWFN